MKAHLIQIAVIVVTVVGPLLATPVAATPTDPDSFLVTPIRQGDCYFGASFGDPRNGLCPSDLPQLVTNQPGSSRPASAGRLQRNAAAAATPAGSLQYTLEMQMTTNTRHSSEQPAIQFQSLSYEE